MKNLSLYFSKIITTGSSFAFNILLAKAAGVDYFGVFGLFIILTFIANYFADWGISVYGPVALAESSDSRLYVQSVFRFKVIATGFFLICYLAVIFIFYAKYANLLCLGTLVVLSNLFNFDWLLRSLSLMHWVAFRQVAHAVLNLCCAGLIVYFNLPIVSAFAAYAGSILLSYLVLFYCLISKGHLIIPKLHIGRLWQETKHFISATKQAFIGLVLFNLLYAFNMPLLTFFSGGGAATEYMSYYNLFSSVSAVILIAQDIYFAQYRSNNHKPFIRFYARQQTLGGVIVTGILLVIPYYYPYIYPKTFGVRQDITATLAFLGILYSFRLFTIHQFLLLQQYRRFLFLHLMGLTAFIAGVALVQKLGYFNPFIAYMLIVFVEFLQIMISVIWLKESIIKALFVLFIFLVWIGIVFLLPQSVYVFASTIIIVVIAGILFLRGLLAPIPLAYAAAK